MKKSLTATIILILTLTASSVYGQWVTDVNGNVSIDRVGTTTATKVTINNSTSGIVKSSELYIGEYRIGQGYSGNYCGTGSFSIYNASYPTLSPRFTMYNGRIGFSFQTNVLCNSSVYNSPAKYVFDTLAAMNRLYIGDVTQTFPSLNPQYRLHVGGKVICEELVVKLQANWPDFVFSPNYKLKPLSEVKNFIAENNHLPGVPAACDVEENGVATGEMLTIQMKKIEELTLYMIQMQEENEALKKRIEALEVK